MNSAVSEESGMQSNATGGKSLLKGMIAGMIGGLAATAARSVTEKFYPTHHNHENDPGNEPVMEMAERMVGHAFDSTETAIASESIHWGFGALTGAAYGGLAEYFPAATSKDGASFGVALASLTQGGALPAMGIGADPEEHTAREQTSEMAGDVVYGIVTETVRRFVRQFLR